MVMANGFFAGKTVVVMGLGRFGGGIDTAKFAAGSAKKVIVTDMAKESELAKSVAALKGIANIEFHLGGHLEEDFRNCDVVISNPAVPPENKYLKIARDSGREITSQINIFFAVCPAMKIAITGANGKSTTTSLTAHLLKAGLGQAGYAFTNVWLGGNIGNEPLLTILDQIKPTDAVVLELSSFQLEHLAQTQRMPDVSLITNLTPNHLDRHGTFENYCRAKEYMFEMQKLDGCRPAVSVFNGDDKISREWYTKYKNDKGRICYLTGADDVDGKFAAVFPLPGRANLENLAGAFAIAKHFGVSDERIIESLGKFISLPHRLELCGTVDGVRYYNDSIATTPVSVIVALDAFKEPKVIIAGGYDKHIPFDELGREMAKKAKAVVLIGQTAKAISEAIRNGGGATFDISFADSLENAIKAARAKADRGDVVIMSPACASYDMFENFQQRGNMFRDFVKAMA